MVIYLLVILCPVRQSNSDTSFLITGSIFSPLVIPSALPLSIMSTRYSCVANLQWVMPSTFASNAVRLSMFSSPAKVVSVLLVVQSILRTVLIQSLPNLSIVHIDILYSLFPKS